jgi:NitT/TauT family transport system substrate-binding protein
MGLSFKTVFASLAAILAVNLGGAALAQSKIRVGVLKLASSGPVFIAQEKGFFKAAGVEVDLKFFEAAQPVAVAIVSGDLDFGVTAFSAALYNLAGKGAIKVIAAQAREEPGYALNAYLAGSKAYAAGFDSLAKFQGRSIAITQTGSSFHYSAGLLADKLGFDVARVRLVALQSIPNMISALRGGQVDGAILPATVATPLIASGEAVLLGWVGDQTPWQVNGVFTATKTAADGRAVVQAFIKGYQAGAQAYHDAFLVKDAAGKIVGGPDREELLAILAKYTEQKPEQILLGIPYVDPKGRLLVDDVYRQVKWYQGQGVVDRDVDPKKLLDLSFVEGHFGVPN